MNSKCVLLLVALFAAHSAQADLVSSFDNGTEDWLVVAYPFHSYDANPVMQAAIFDSGFGNPAGSLRIGDVYSETGVAAPPPFLGDKSSSYGQAISYDILIRFVDVGAFYPAVVLKGSTMSVYYDTVTPTLGEWETRSIPLTEAGWRLSGTNAEVDEATFRGILADLTGLYIYTEWHSGADDTSFDNVRLGGTAVGVDDQLNAALLLHPCYPNPFNPLTTIRFELPASGPVRVAVFDVAGHLVRTLVDTDLPEGKHETIWDGRDTQGRSVSSGHYIARLEAGGQVQVMGMGLVR